MLIFFFKLFQPRDLLKQYEKLDKDPHRFMFWMKSKCQANAGHARKTCDVVKSANLDDQGKKDPQNNADQRKTTKTLPLLMLPMPKKPIVVGDAVWKTPIKSFSTPLVGQPSKPKPPAKSELKSAPINIDENKSGTNVINHRLFKLKDQFQKVHNTANMKMVELHSELGKMQQMSNEFNSLAKFLSSEAKMSTFEKNLDRLQKTISLTGEKVLEIDTNNNKVRRMLRDINEVVKKQHGTNEKSINGIEERLTRWEFKLDRLTRKMSNQKVDQGDLKLNDNDYRQLKGDIQNMLLNDERLNELTTNLKMMKKIVLSIVLLIIFKDLVIDSVQKDFFFAKE